MRFAFGCLALGVAACGSARAPTDASCPLADGIVRAGLVVEPRDSTTGAWLLAKVQAEDGAFVEILAPAPGVPNGGAPINYSGLGRAGTYMVTVSAPGYLVWRRADVVLTADAACRVQLVSLTARLLRAP